MKSCLKSCCYNCGYFSNSPHLKCAINPLPNHTLFDFCDFYEFNRELDLISTIASFKIVSLLNGKFQFELWTVDISNNELDHWWDKRIFSSHREVLQTVREILPISPLWYSHYAYLIVDEADEERWKDIIYKNWAIILTDEPEDLILIDPLTNQEFYRDDLNLNGGDYLTYSDEINLIKDWIDNFEEMRDRSSVPGQLTLF